jgi:pimeloyl-ACP methyl ester carboxylesterase
LVHIDDENAQIHPSHSGCARSGATCTSALVDGHRIHVRIPTHQSAVTHHDPIVLIHGLGVSSRYMVPTLVRLMSTLRVYALDLPGFGHSSGPHTALPLTALADSVAGWMSAAGLSRATLLGNSLGCQVITTLAQRHPDLVSRAILVSPTCDPSAPSAIRQIARLLADAPREHPSEVALATADYLRAGPRRMWHTLLDALNSPVQDQLAHLNSPTLVVRGGHGAMVSQEWAEKVTALLPHGHLAVIPDAPHAANYDAPEQLAALVTTFLTEHDDTARTCPT